MTERDYLESLTPRMMLEFAGSRVSPRKLRLFAVACCRRLGDLLGEPEARAVRLAAALADGAASQEEADEGVGELLRRREDFGRQQLRDAGANADRFGAFRQAAEAALAALHESPFYAACEASGCALLAIESRASYLSREHGPPLDASARRQVAELELAAQAALLRDLTGRLTRAGRTRLEKSWVRWDAGAVRQIAQRIYDEERFEDVPILADALADAGCDAAELLEHCRGGGEHVRGCWAVDLVLGKE
jgi:hypothetical protein